MTVYCSDLTHIEDGNADALDNGMVNFEKMRMIAAVWRDIARFQQLRVAYCFQPIDQLQRWFLELPVLSDDDLYGMSLAVEPRTPNSPALDARPRSGSLSRVFGSLRRSSPNSPLK